MFDLKEWIDKLPKDIPELPAPSVDVEFKWGIFDLAALSGEVHAVPIYENGYPRIGHTLSLHCACKPHYEQYVYKMVAHNDVLDT